MAETGGFSGQNILNKLFLLKGTIQVLEEKGEFTFPQTNIMFIDAE